MNRYDKAFKEKAVRLSDEIGPKKAAEQLGVRSNLIKTVLVLNKRRRTQNQHIGVSRGGKTTKLHTVIDGFGGPSLFF
ncbi:hypothetical protein B1748_09070 [Paenibacillus sp. MY03]|uniref:hypothetical protein n=1 Tax=Paenibacillus sp. MY03 TaxID=302980 RepID=UPI000B3C279F|nr:hypothetical protein B1748_09070 [Paenibacillus sp. MY03]